MRARRERATRDRDLREAVGEVCAESCEVVDREVDAGERLARVVDDLQVGGALGDVVDLSRIERTSVGDEHVDRGERILVRDRVGELADRGLRRVRAPLPNIAVTASMPTPSSAATPVAAISVP